MIISSSKNFPQYFAPFLSVRWRTGCQAYPCTQLCQALLASGSVAALCEHWQRGSIWIAWCRSLTWEARSHCRTRGAWNFLQMLLVMYVDFATLVSGRRRTAALPAVLRFVCGMWWGWMCTRAVYPRWRWQPLLLPSSHRPIFGDLWVSLRGAAQALELRCNCSGITAVTAAGLGHLVAFFRHSRLCLVVTTLNRSPSVSVLRWDFQCSVVVELLKAEIKDLQNKHLQIT